jgi:SAM-dependent methyltransferase
MSRPLFRWIPLPVKAKLWDWWWLVRSAPARVRERMKPPEPPRVSETSKVRASLAPFCVGDGVDVGFGGDPIVPTAIAMDLPERYARYLENPQHLHGDAANLHWFRDGVLDYVFSSHVLEDFEDTAAVVREWVRVLKPGGRLVLFLPDEQTYRAHCRAIGNPPNAHHVHENFGLPYLKSCLPANVTVEHERFPVGIYSFELVVRKTAPN